MPNRQIPDLSHVVAENIQRIRVSKKMSRRDLSEKAGWGKKGDMVYQLEKSLTGASFRTIGKLADVMDVDPAEFFRSNSASGPVSVPSQGAVLVQLSSLRGYRPDLDDAAQFWEKASISPPEWMIPKDDGCIRVLIGDERVDSVLRKGDIVAVDIYGRLPPSDVSPDSLYVIRLESEVRISRLEIAGQILTLPSPEAGESPILIDLRAHPSTIIGRVVWMIRSL